MVLRLMLRVLVILLMVCRGRILSVVRLVSIRMLVRRLVLLSLLMRGGLMRLRRLRVGVVF